MANYKSLIDFISVEVGGTLQLAFQEILETDRLQSERAERERAEQKRAEQERIEREGQRQQNIRTTRARVSEIQEKNAKKVVTASERLLGTAKIGDNVVYLSSEFDRGIADPPNILCKVIDIDSHQNYQLACGAGILNRYMPRNAFQIVGETIEFPINRVKIVSPREAIAVLSVGGGQGFTKCECNGQCKTKRCSCFKENLKCKSRCHGSNKSCCNKE